MQGIDDLAGRPTCADPYQQGEARSLDQRRADALTGFINDHSFWDVTVQVQIPADMLMGVETKGADLNGSPCTRRLAQHLAWSPDARWTRLVTDPLTGVLMDTGTHQYEIPAKVRTAVRLRDRLCRFPGCTRLAEFTDTDHVIPHRENGLTHTDGLICLCRTHHRIKTFENWQLSTTDPQHHDRAGKLSRRGTTGALQCTLTGLEVGRTYTVIASATGTASVPARGDLVAALRDDSGDPSAACLAAGQAHRQRAPGTVHHLGFGREFTARPAQTGSSVRARKTVIRARPSFDHRAWPSHWAVLMRPGIVESTDTAKSNSPGLFACSCNTARIRSKVRSSTRR